MGVGSDRNVMLRRNRNFVLLTVGQICSGAGTSAATLAYPLLLLALTHSAVIAGTVGTARAVTQLLAGLPAGALADRWDRRRTIITCDALRLAVMAVLTVLVVTHTISWPVVLLLSVIDGAGGVLVPPAEAGVLAEVVSAEQLDAAYATFEARTSTSELAGTAAGGALFAAGRSLPFLGDAVSYAISVLTAARLRGHFTPTERTTRTGISADITEGLAFVWRTPLLRAVILQAPLLNFAFTGALFTITLALRQHGISPAGIGGLQAGIALGGLFGALLATRLTGGSILARVLGVTGAATLLFGVAAVLLPSPLVAVPVGILFVFAPFANVALFAAMARATPDELRGRVYNSVILAVTTLAAAAPLTAGLLLQYASATAAMAVFALAAAAAFGLLLLLPGLRTTSQEVEEPPRVR